MKHKTIQPTVFFILSLGMMLLFSCSIGNDSIAGGSGSETPNTITIIADRQGINIRTLQSADVSIFAVDYTPFNDSGFDTTLHLLRGTTSVNLVEGAYNILVSHFDTLKGFASRIEINPSALDTTILDTKSDASIMGTIVNANSMPLKDVTVYVKGTPYFAKTGIDGSFFMDNVASGQFVVSAQFLLYDKDGNLLLALHADSSVRVPESGIAAIGEVMLQ